MESLTPNDGIRDTRMAERAIKQRWPVADEWKDALIKRLVRIAIDPATSNREATSAIKAVLAAEAQNQQDEHHAEGATVSHVHEIAERRSRLSAIAERLGIRGVVIDAATAEPDIDDEAIGGASADE